MKIQILQENLIKGLNLTSRLITSKTQLPVLANTLFTTEGNRLKIASTNLEMGIVVWLGAKIEKEGAITLPSKILQEYVSSLPAEKIELTVEENTATLISDRFKASFNGISANEFPLLPKGDKKIFSFSGGILSEVISQVVYASANDEGRPILTGVLIKNEGGILTFAATDGYRLSVKRINVEKSFEKDFKKNLVIPAKCLFELGKIISEVKKQEENLVEMTLTEDGNQAIFVFPDIELSTRLLEGEFPDFEKIIPREFTTRVYLDKEEITQAIRISSIFARDSANIVKLSFTDGKVIISANSPQIGENIAEVEGKIEGEGNQIAFNYRFLLDFLNNISSDQIVFEMNGSLNPGVFKPKDDDSFFHIIMPVRLQS